VQKRNQQGKEKAAERDRRRGIPSLKIVVKEDNAHLLEETFRGLGNNKAGSFFK